MREWINLCEDEQLLNLWDLMSHYGVKESRMRFHDAVLPWINRNAVTCINRASKNKKNRLMSKIVFWGKRIAGIRNWAEKFATPEMFEAALPKTITLWRAGGGVYDPDHLDNQNRDWVSMTADRNRTKTFAEYDGTYASHSYRLPERRGPWWIVELTLPLDEILLYLDGGFDEEVIVSKETARRARVVETGGQS